MTAVAKRNVIRRILVLRVWSRQFASFASVMIVHSTGAIKRRILARPDYRQGLARLPGILAAERPLLLPGCTTLYGQVKQ